MSASSATPSVCYNSTLGGATSTSRFYFNNALRSFDSLRSTNIGIRSIGRITTSHRATLISRMI